MILETFIYLNFQNILNIQIYLRIIMRDKAEILDEDQRQRFSFSQNK